MARSFWTTLSLALTLQFAAMAGYVAISVHDQAEVVSATLMHMAVSGDVVIR